LQTNQSALTEQFQSLESSFQKMEKQNKTIKVVNNVLIGSTVILAILVAINLT